MTALQGHWECFLLPMWENFPIVTSMEQLIREIETYCAALGVKPQKLLRDVIGASWRQWDAWKAGTSSPTMAVADRLRTHMAAHPPKAAAGSDGAGEAQAKPDSVEDAA
jgi:hypothetical protein